MASPHAPAGLACVSVLVALPALFNGFMMDDFWHRAAMTDIPELRGLIGPASRMFGFTTGDPELLHRLIDMGLLPWWSLDGVVLNFWRPLTVLTHLFDHRLWPDIPMLMHAHNLAWRAGLVYLVALLHRRVIGPGWVASLATLMYAVDGAHTVPVGWIANRNSLVAGFFGVAALILHDEWRGRGRRAAGAAAVGALALALLAKEEGIAYSAYLFAYAVWIDRASWFSRAASLAPYAIVVLVWRATYVLGGYGAWGSATYIDPGSDLLKFIPAALGRWPVLMLAQWAPVLVEPYTFIPSPLPALYWIAGVTWVAVVGRTIVRHLGLGAKTIFWAAGMALALLPSCATFPSARLTIASGIGAMALLAMLFEKAWPSLRSAGGGRTRLSLRLLLYFLALSHLVFAPLTLFFGMLAYRETMQTTNLAIDALVFENADEVERLVIVDAPNMSYTSYLPIKRLLDGRPAPKRLIGLAPNWIRPNPKLILTRIDKHTLRVEPEGGYKWLLSRSDDFPYVPGDEITLTGVTMKIVEVHPESGYPMVVDFVFDVPLEDPTLAWRQVDEARKFVEFAPPTLGETVEIES